MKLRPQKLCKATYTEDGTGRQVACNDQGPPRPAAYRLKGGGLYCKECWVNVENHFLAQYPGKENFAKRGLAKMTVRL